MRLTKDEKESLYWAAAYITDILSGDKASINWDGMTESGIWSAFYKLRKEVEGF